LSKFTITASNIEEKREASFTCFRKYWPVVVFTPVIN